MAGAPSRPLLAATFPAGPLGADAVAWPQGNPIPIGRATLAVLPFLDGKATLEDLLDDATDALDIGNDAVVAAREGTVDDLRSLERAGVVAGLGPRDPLDPDRGSDGVNGVEVAAPGGDGPAESPVEILEVAEEGGQRIVTARLADGRIRRTTTITVTSTSSTEELRDLLGSVALTDLVGAGACAGQRLRAGSPAHDLLVDLGGGPTRVRTDHEPTAEALHGWFAESLLDDSPVTAVADPPGDDAASRSRAGVGVSAYVVAPFEGEGPPRVYDRWGTRVGRPRTGADAAAVVVGLLTDEEPPSSPDVAVLNAFAVEGPHGCVLLPGSLAELPLMRRCLESLGLVGSNARTVVLRPDGQIEIAPAGLSASREVRDLLGCVAVSDDDRHDPAAVFASQLLRGAVGRSLEGARLTLEVLDAVVGDKRVVVVPQADPAVLAAEVMGLAS